MNTKFAKQFRFHTFVFVFLFNASHHFSWILIIAKMFINPIDFYRDRFIKLNLFEQFKYSQNVMIASLFEKKKLKLWITDCGTSGSPIHINLLLKMTHRYWIVWIKMKLKNWMIAWLVQNQHSKVSPDIRGKIIQKYRQFITNNVGHEKFIIKLWSQI